MERPCVDYLIITALEEERDAVLRLLPDPVKQTEGERTYYIAHVPLAKGQYTVVLTLLPGKGPIIAAVTATLAALHWSPKHLMLVGIAGGVKTRVALGDVLVPEQIADYTMEHVQDQKAQIRWSVFRADAMLHDRVKNFTENWRQLIKVEPPTPAGNQRHAEGVVASGGRLIDNERIIGEYSESQGGILFGVEQEAGGVATAVHYLPAKPRFLMVKAVSDLPGEEGNPDVRSRWREHAAAVAAAYTIGLISSAPTQPCDESVKRENPPPSEVPAAPAGQSTPLEIDDKMVRAHLVQVHRTRRVYLVARTGARHGVPDPETLETFARWEDVELLDSESALEQFPAGPPLFSERRGVLPWIVKLRGERKYFRLEEASGVRHQLTGQEEEKADRGGCDVISFPELQRFVPYEEHLRRHGAMLVSGPIKVRAAGTRIPQASDNPPVLVLPGERWFFVVDRDGFRRWLSDPQTRISYPRPAKKVQPADLKQHPPAPPIGELENRPWLAHVRESGRVYLLDQEGHRRRVLDRATIETLGGFAAIDVLVDADELHRFRPGRPIGKQYPPWVVAVEAQEVLGLIDENGTAHQLTFDSAASRSRVLPVDLLGVAEFQHFPQGEPMRGEAFASD